MDIQKLLNAQYHQREEVVQTPELVEHLGDEWATWTVRGLTTREMVRARELASNSESSLRTLVEAFAGNGDKAGEIRKAMRLSDENSPVDFATRVEALVLGSVKPEMSFETREAAIIVSEISFAAFMRLTSAIYNLTGQGAEPGKRKPSGKTRE